MDNKPANETGPENIRALSLNKKLRSGINLLVLLHLAAFTIAYFSGQGSLSFLALSAGAPSGWWTGMFSYQFAHSSTGELLLSMTMLWFFGQLLARQLGERKVILLYFISVTFAGLIFMVAQLLFPVFSGPAGIMDGAFGGVLAIMTFATMMMPAHRIRLGRRTVSMPGIYFGVLAISLFLVYRHNMACVLMYAGCIYAGIQLMLFMSGREEKKMREELCYRIHNAAEPK